MTRLFLLLLTLLFSLSSPAMGKYSDIGRSSLAPGTRALTKYDPDFARSQIMGGGKGKASDIVKWAEGQGWARSQTAGGPMKFVDENGVVRATVKRGSSRTPGSANPHVELRDASGQRIDPYGNPVKRRSPGNHTSIDWDLE